MDDMTMAAIAYDAYRTIPETMKGMYHVSALHFSRMPSQRQRAWATAVAAVVKEVGVEDLEDRIERLEEDIEGLKEDLKWGEEKE